MTDLEVVRPRLTHLVRFAGCAAKIGPAQLGQALKNLPITADTNLLVGLTTGDDAGVYRIGPELALVQTLDFFTPIVDDPYLFGQIAACNSLSDVYAMAGRPITAMNIVCYPIKERDPAELAAILRGGADKVTEAGAALVGGHSIDDPEPKFGMSVTGLVHPDHVTTNAGAQPGDVIVLTKPLGTGIISTARKFDGCPEVSFDAAATGMVTLNAGAAEAMRAVGIGVALAVHAATDITGFGIIGHLYHVAKASGVSIRLNFNEIPLYPGTLDLADNGFTTAGGKRNLEYLSTALQFDRELASAEIATLSDPQTSGGLAICVAPGGLKDLLKELAVRGVLVQAIIGEVTKQDGNPELRIS